MSRILITGGTGRLGSVLTNQLLQLNHDVYVLSSQEHSTLPVPIKIIKGDLTTMASLQYLGDYEVVVHCASNPLHYRSVDVDGSINLLRALHKHQPQHFIYVSIVGVERSINPYYLAKREVEKMIMDVGFNWSILRATQFHHFVLNMFIKPFDHPTNDTIVIPAGLVFQSVDLSDVVASLIEIIQHPPTQSISTIVGPERLTIEDMTQDYLEVFNLDASVDAIPMEGELYMLFRSGTNLGTGERKGKISWRTYLENLKQQVSGPA